MFVVDSSAWVVMAGRRGDVEALAGGEEIAVCPPVIHEFLRGVGNRKQFDLAREMFYNLVILDAPLPLQRFEEAALLYMRCRDQGVTVRKGFDCVIAATALAHGAGVLHRDNDFDHMAEVVPLRVKRI